MSNTLIWKQSFPSIPLTKKRPLLQTHLSSLETSNTIPTPCGFSSMLTKASDLRNTCNTFLLFPGVRDSDIGGLMGKGIVVAMSIMALRSFYKKKCKQDLITSLGLYRERHSYDTMVNKATPFHSYLEPNTRCCRDWYRSFFNFMTEICCDHTFIKKALRQKKGWIYIYIWFEDVLLDIDVSVLVL